MVQLTPRDLVNTIPMTGKTLEYIQSELRRRKLHFTLIDPDKVNGEQAAQIAKECFDGGTAAIMLGGSTGVTIERLSECAKAIKKTVPTPVIHFPTSDKVLSPYVDAIFFMSLLNSKNPDFIIRRQASASIYIQKLNIEPLSVAYLIIEPGMTVGKVGEAELIGKNDIETAVKYALAARFFGFNFIYLEAGSGAPEPVTVEMVHAVKKSCSLPLIVGGGIRTAEQAKLLASGGADIIVTGTLIEEKDNVSEYIKNIVEVINK